MHCATGDDTCTRDQFCYLFSRRNMLRMFVYMKTLDEEIVEQQKSYTEMDFLGMCY